MNLKRKFKLWIWKFIKSELPKNQKPVKLNLNSHDLYNIITEWTVFNYGKISLEDFIEEVQGEYEENNEG